MRTALELAARGRYRVAPNPMVGAVLVRNRRIVGRGYHRFFGGPHAEVEAIRDAGERAKGAALYVTMEPCCFCGKTPACTDLLVEAGITRVVAATRDPHRLVSGKGMRLLSSAGIGTSVGLLARAARQLNEAYFSYHLRHRPFVVLKLALSLDGMLATQSGESQWITGPAARRWAQEQRCSADAVLVGVNTVLRDNPRLTCRAAKGKRLLRVVLDSRLRTSPNSRLFESRTPVLVFTRARTGSRVRQLETRGAEVVQVRSKSDGFLSWQEVLKALYERQVLSVLIEGGATAASSALESGIVDKVCVIRAPKVIGPGLSFSAHMRARGLSQALRLRQVRHRVFGDDVVTEGYLRTR